MSISDIEVTPHCLIIFIIHTGNTIHFVKEIYNVIKNQIFYKNKKRHLIMDSLLRNLTKYTSIYTCSADRGCNIIQVMIKGANLFMFPVA
jgi:hypothetical protein